MAKKCEFRKKNGEPCNADAQMGKNVCVFHDPARKADGRRARRAGGVNRTRVGAVLPTDTPDRPLQTPKSISTLLEESINQLRTGQLDPRVANAIGCLANVQLRSFEQEILSDRLASVEYELGLVASPQIGDTLTARSKTPMTSFKSRLERVEEETRFKLWDRRQRILEDLSPEEGRMFSLTRRLPDRPERAPGSSRLDAMDHDQLMKLRKKNEQWRAGRSISDLEFFALHGHWPEQGCSPECEVKSDGNSLTKIQK